MIDVHWMEKVAGGLPADDEWLSLPEAFHLRSLRVAKRRDDWRLGRWTAKCLVAACLDVRAPLGSIEIRPAPDGAPEVYLAGKAVAVSISISHCARAAVSALTLSPAALGCDLERIEPRSPAFLADFFNAEEQALVDGAPEQDRPRLVTLLWSAKESALKALRAGLRLDTRRVTVALAEALADWSPLHVRYSGQRIFQGWWRCAGGFVLTLVADPPPAPPITVPCRMPRPAIPSRSG